MDDVKTTIRLIGVDTPETVDPRKPVECFGKEATNKILELLSTKIVVLEEDQSQGDKDKYGRLLRYVFLPDGTNVNKELILQGFAYEYTYDLPYRYQDEFKKAQISARESKRGLWADNACASPSPSP
jgi:micrococcal nuclease